jgi:hypothetical protein
MHVNPATIIGFALFVFALAMVPVKYKPAWIYRLSWWQMLIGLIATASALLIVMNPEFLALGLLGDSAFFDILVLAIGIQLQTILARMGVYVLAGGKRMLRYINLHFCVTCTMLAFIFADVVWAVQRAVQRFTS